MSPNSDNASYGWWRYLMGCLATVGIFTIMPALPAAAQLEECNFLESPQRFNTSPGEDGRIIIGQFSERPYVVLLTRHLQDNLPTIQACIPDAFLTSSRLGPYIHIASFDNYREARDLVENIDNFLGINVRLMHHERLSR